MTKASQEPVEVVGRYALHAPIAKGGMAIVHLARILGPEGFSRVVAAKRLLPQYVEDTDFVAMFLDEAKIASKIHHPNVVPVIDVVFANGEVILVQEYVHGVPLDKLCKVARTADEGVAPAIAIAITEGILSGLHAAHEAKDDYGEPLNVVHRDVSPHNVMVTIDGVARVLDFGIAKARSSSHVTREGVFKGKLSYLAPEQLVGNCVTRRADVYGAGVIMWELLTGRRLFAGEKIDATRIMAAVVNGEIPTMHEALADELPRLTPERRQAIDLFDPIVTRALAMAPDSRYDTAQEMLDAILKVSRPASPKDVAAWVRETGKEFLESNQQAILESEEASRSLRLDFEYGPESASRIMVTRGSNQGPHSGAPHTVDVTSTRRSPTARQYRITAFLGAAFFVSMAIFALVRPMREAAAPSPSPASAPPGVVVQATPQNAQVEAPAAHAVAVAPTASPVVSPVRSPPPPTAVRPPPPARPRVPEKPRAAADFRAGDTRGGDAPPPPSTAPLPTPTQSADCTPPYFWEGSKKVYKPNCL